ncbi:MAG: hypothetical protein V3U99_08675, partial [Alphaproteobacteria bacterium]
MLQPLPCSRLAKNLPSFLMVANDDDQTPWKYWEELPMQSAVAIQNAAYVRALGQIELVFTFIAAQVVFRERSTRLEIGGIALIV